MIQSEICGDMWIFLFFRNVIRKIYREQLDMHRVNLVCKVIEKNTH